MNFYDQTNQWQIYKLTYIYVAFFKVHPFFLKYNIYVYNRMLERQMRFLAATINQSDMFYFVILLPERAATNLSSNDTQKNKSL